ncbi:MAG: RecB family exonuclease [Acidimicrobiales bacterium]
MAELPEYLSPSSASSFDGCPRRWKFKYVDRLPEPSGEAALVGSFAHLVLEHLCQRQASERTLDAAKLLARSLWDEFALDEDYVSLELNPDDARAFRWNAWQCIAGLWELEDPANVEVVSTEEKVRTVLGDVPFVGIIDRVDQVNDELVVTDYKSGTLPGIRWRDDKIQQVLLYAAALYAETGEMPRSARLIYLKQSIVDIPVTQVKIDDAIGQLSTTWANLSSACAADEFEASPGVLCGWCPFAAQCPEGRAELTRREAAGKLPAHAPARSLVA